MTKYRQMTIAWLAFLLAAPLAAPAGAQEITSYWPQEEPRITSAILSRTGMTVRDIEASLKLYRDILGLEPFYERSELDDPRLVDFSGLEPGQTLRLVVLRTRTNGPAMLNAGYLGLSEIYDADGRKVELPQQPAGEAVYGSMALLFVVEDTNAIYEQVKAGGYDIISAPERRADGTSTQLLMRGPDGERLWITSSTNRGPFQEKNGPN